MLAVYVFVGRAVKLKFPATDYWAVLPAVLNLALWLGIVKSAGQSILAMASPPDV
jgi:hypothetical protein